MKCLMLMRYTFIFILLSCFGCRGGAGGGNGPQLPEPPPPPLPEIDAINFFLENSRSMAGYVYFPTDFSENIDRVIVGLEQRFKGKLRPFTIGQNVGNYEEDIVKFREDLNPTNGKRISIDDSSLLHKIIKEVIDSTGENQISILVTDGIMSGSNRDLAKYDDHTQNLYFNIDNARTRLKGDITLALSSRPPNKALKILAFHSDFESGKRVSKNRYYYYKADNNKFHEPLKGNLPKRPYYLMVYGDPRLIRSLEEKTKQLILPKKTIELGFQYDAIDFYLTNDCKNRLNTRARSIASGDGGGKHEIDFDESEKNFRFAFLLNLEGMDRMFQDEKYLENNLTVTVGKQTFTSMEILDPHKVADINELWFSLPNNYDRYTHLVTFVMEGYKPNRQDVLKIRLENNPEKWVATWHSDNDLNMRIRDSTTFGLKYLIEGMRDAFYQGEKVYVFDHEIQVKTY